MSPSLLLTPLWLVLCHLSTHSGRAFLKWPETVLGSGFGAVSVFSENAGFLLLIFRKGEKIVDLQS